METLIGAQEGLLGEIFSLASVTAQPVTGVVDNGLVAAYEFPVSIDLTLSRAQDQGTV
jgi:hypothetical protein